MYKLEARLYTEDYNYTNFIGVFEDFTDANNIKKEFLKKRDIVLASAPVNPFINVDEDNLDEEVFDKLANTYLIYKAKNRFFMDLYDIDIQKIELNKNYLCECL